MLPLFQSRLEPLPAHLLLLLLLPGPVHPRPRPGGSRASSLASGRWTTLWWTSKCSCPVSFLLLLLDLDASPLCDLADAYDEEEEGGGDGAARDQRACSGRVFLRGEWQCRCSCLPSPV